VLVLGGCHLFEPRVPRNLQAKLVGSEVVVTWDSVLGAETYELCRRIEGGFGTGGECLPVPDASRLRQPSFSTNDAPHAGSTFFFRVRSRNGAGESPWSADSAGLSP
jgi:hypothetical protein